MFQENRSPYMGLFPVKIIFNLLLVQFHTELGRIVILRNNWSERNIHMIGHFEWLKKN